MTSEAIGAGASGAPTRTQIASASGNRLYCACDLSSGPGCQWPGGTASAAVAGLAGSTWTPRRLGPAAARGRHCQPEWHWQALEAMPLAVASQEGDRLQGLIAALEGDGDPDHGKATSS